jgi:hypothetical protein
MASTDNALAWELYRSICKAQSRLASDAVHGLADLFDWDVVDKKPADDTAKVVVIPEGGTYKDSVSARKMTEALKANDAMTFDSPSSSIHAVSVVSVDEAKAHRLAGKPIKRTMCVNGVTLNIDIKII